MLPDRVSNPGPLTYESGALPIALRGPDNKSVDFTVKYLASGCQFFYFYFYGRLPVEHF